MTRLLYELTESFRIAFAQIRANKMRSALTALGVIIGIVAVTLMGTAIRGIDIGFEREGRARTRMIRITTTGQPVAPESRGLKPSASSAPSAETAKSNVGNGFETRNLRTVGDPADGSRGEISAIVRANPLKTNIETDADGADEILPPHSAPETTGWRARL